MQLMNNSIKSEGSENKKRFSISGKIAIILCACLSFYNIIKLTTAHLDNGRFTSMIVSHEKTSSHSDKILKTDEPYILDTRTGMLSKPNYNPDDYLTEWEKIQKRDQEQTKSVIIWFFGTVGALIGSVILIFKLRASRRESVLIGEHHEKKLD